MSLRLIEVLKYPLDQSIGCESGKLLIRMDLLEHYWLCCLNPKLIPKLIFQCRLLHRADRGRDFDSHRQDFPGRTFRPGRDGLRVRRRRRRQDLGERSQRFVALSFN